MCYAVFVMGLMVVCPSGILGLVDRLVRFAGRSARGLAPPPALGNEPQR
jgi:hypothetical protein